MNKLYNMSAPPRSHAVYNFIDNNKYYLLSVDILTKHFACSKKKLYKKVLKYYSKYKDIINKELIGKYANLKEFNKNNNLCIEDIKDVNVILSILLRTYNGLYVPNKLINITNDRFKSSYLIRKEDLCYGK